MSTELETAPNAVNPSGWRTRAAESFAPLPLAKPAFQGFFPMATRSTVILLIGEVQANTRQIADDLARDGRQVQVLNLNDSHGKSVARNRANSAAADAARLAETIRATVGPTEKFAALLVETSQHPAAEADEIIGFGELQINLSRREVWTGPTRVRLSKGEFGLLSLLVQRAGRVFTREQIIRECRGTNYPVTDRSVDMQIAGIRRKLGPLSLHIETIRGVGYRFVETPPSDEP